MRALQPCGTRAAYLRHLRHHETPCGPCRAANAAASRAQLEWREPAPPLRHTSRTDLYPLIEVLDDALRGEL